MNNAPVYQAIHECTTAINTLLVSYNNIIYIIITVTVSSAWTMALQPTCGSKWCQTNKNLTNTARHSKRSKQILLGAIKGQTQAFRLRCTDLMHIKQFFGPTHPNEFTRRSVPQSLRGLRVRVQLRPKKTFFDNQTISLTVDHTVNGFSQ